MNLANALATGAAVLLGSGAAVASGSDGRVASVVLEDFERPDAEDDWSARQVEFNLFDRQSPAPAGSARAARLAYPRWSPWRGKWPAVILEHGDGQFRTSDWSLYSVLRFEARARHPRVVHLKLRIDDGDGRRAIRIIPIASNNWNTCEISLAGLADDIDTEHVRRVDFYMSQPAADYEIDLDDLRLEAVSIALEAAALTIDPFQRGSLVVRARFNKRASWRVAVTDTAGLEVAAFTGNGTRLHLREVLSAPVPGRHTVTLHLLGHHGSTAARNLGSLYLDSADGSGERSSQIVAWLEPSTRKVLLHDLPAADRPVFAPGESGSESPLRLTMAQGETEAFQLVLRTKESRAGIHVAVGAIQQADGYAVFPERAISVNRVLYVDAQEPEEYNVDYSGWWPDPLVPGDRLVVEPGENAPVWIALESAIDQQPGLYRSQIQIHIEEQSDVLVVPFEVRVYPAAVPAATTVQTAFSFYESSLSPMYGDSQAEKLLPLYRQLIGAHRLNATNIYTRTPPAPEALAVLRDSGRLNRFVALYLETREYDTDELEEIAETLAPYVAEYDRLGLLPQAMLYGFDEARVDEFSELKEVFAFFKQRYPGLQTATTAADPSLGMGTGLDAVVDVWVPLTAYHDPVTAATARATGAQVWWYICIAPTHPHANWFIEYPALEARLLWWMSHRQRVDGFLYYTLNRWPGNERPLQLPERGNKVGGWNPASLGTANGDGCLLYPGPDGPLTSIRLENIRDGIEDQELLRMLAGHDAGRADQLCDDVVGQGGIGFTRDPERFARTRQQLLESLSQVTAGDARHGGDSIARP